MRREVVTAKASIPTSSVWPWAPRAVHIRHPVQRTQHPQDMAEVIHRRPCIQLLYAVHNLLQVRAPRAARVVPASPGSTHALRQVLRHRLPCLLHGPCSSAASLYLSALAESGPQSKVPPYVGISAYFS
jgi:hypothetical protein